MRPFSTNHFNTVAPPVCTPIEDLERLPDIDCGLSSAVDDQTSAWTQEEAIRLCSVLERIAPDFGCHVALTGGTLYKPGLRKDVDILFYRIRQAPEIDRYGLVQTLVEIGFELDSTHGWVQKMRYGKKCLDLFFPDHIDQDGENGVY